jgi:YfiH family protein
MILPAPFEQSDEHLAVGLPGARVVFTTRRGGFSQGPFESLNLGKLTADEPEAVDRNRARVRDLVGRPLAMVRQVHGAIVHRAENVPELPNLAQGDGLVTADTDRAAVVLVADCLPVAVAGAGAVAMLHAGWRGLSAGVVAAGLASLRQQGDGPFEAAVGPGIRACCYEVGPEVHEAFGSYGARVRRGNNLDLAAVARAQLQQAGVEVVHDVGLCTACHPELFFSHRRDRGLTGRQSGIAWLT